MTPTSLVSFLLCIQNKIPLKLSWNDSIKELMEVMLTIMLLLCDFLVKLSKLTQFVILSEKNIMCSVYQKLIQELLLSQLDSGFTI